MREFTEPIVKTTEASQEPAHDGEPLAGSGFEEEQPEPDFDERI